jgi:aspartyl-tRNA(Asn)/glutamyl-tRNA(Gln) amidotransferase subunit B
LNKEGIEIGDSRIEAAALAALLNRIADDTITGKIAKEVFDSMWSGEGAADDIIEAKGLKQITDSSAIESIVDAVIAANPAQADDYRAGKDKLLGFFVGQVMKKTGGKANPGQVNDILRKKLSGS